jgi:hypothetical protein
MFDRILYTTAFALSAVQNWLEKMELGRQEKQLKQWNQFVPAPVNARQPVRVAKAAK